MHVQRERAGALGFDEAGGQRAVGWPSRSVWLCGAHADPSATRAAHANNVVGVAARIDASGLKVRDDASLKARGESSSLRLRVLRVRTLSCVRVLKELAGLDDVAHLPGVVVPVRGQAPHSPIAQQACNLESEIIRDQATLAVTRLAPRIREERPDLVQGCVPEHDGQSLRGRRASMTRMLSTSASTAFDISFAMPGTHTSSARKSRPGCAEAAATICSPVPEPISSVTGALRPNSASRSSVKSSATVV